MTVLKVILEYWVLLKSVNEKENYLIKQALLFVYIRKSYNAGPQIKKCCIVVC